MMFPITRKEFLSKDELEQKEFISKLLHAIRNDDHYYQFALSVVGNAQLDGMFNDVKFGDEVYSPELIGLQPLS